MNQKQIDASVFYAKKHLDNSTSFECAVLLTPVHEFHRAAYSFAVEMHSERAYAQAVTYDREKAERIFNSIVCKNVGPCELEAFLRSFSE